MGDRVRNNNNRRYILLETSINTRRKLKHKLFPSLRTSSDFILILLFEVTKTQIPLESDILKRKPQKILPYPDGRNFKTGSITTLIKDITKSKQSGTLV